MSSLLSAGLLICSLPSPDVGWLGWVALVPLMVACHDLAPLRAAGLGLLFGIVSSFGIYGWLFEVPAFDLRHAIVLALYVAIYPTLWCAAVAWVARRHAPLILTGPILWVVADYLRAHAGFLALPWGTLAQTQHSNLAVLQIASLGGEHAVTFFVALGNVALAGLILGIDRRSAVIAIIALVLTHLWGATVLFNQPQGANVSVVAIQPNIQLADRTTEDGREASLGRLEELTRRVAADRPSLIVWPESAIPGELRSDSILTARLQRLVDEIETSLIVGAAQVEKFATGDSEITIGRRIFNSAHLLKPGQPSGQPYRKRVLVPFAEYLPQSKIIPWPEWLAPRVTEMTPGDHSQLFNVTTDLSAGALICWENLFASLARESVREGANVLVQLTNDVWFGRSAAPLQHNLMSVMRAVENRVPIVIASNTGPSQIIDSYGKVVTGVPGLFHEGVVTGEVTVGAGPTLYTITGDSAMLVGLLSLAGGMICHARSVGRRRTIPPKPSAPPDRRFGDVSAATMKHTRSKECIS
ncbi:MAG: putative Apolipoprotein N-acyltransferase [Nitrospira sp.]